MVSHCQSFLVRCLPPLCPPRSLITCIRPSVRMPNTISFMVSLLDSALSLAFLVDSITLQYSLHVSNLSLEAITRQAHLHQGCPSTMGCSLPLSSGCSSLWYSCRSWEQACLGHN